MSALLFAAGHAACQGELWSAIEPGFGTQTLDVARDLDGGIYVAGTIGGNPFFTNVARFDADGRRLFRVTLEQASSLAHCRIAIHPAGGVVIGNGTGVYRISNTGSVEWLHRDSATRSVTVASSGRIVSASNSPWSMVGIDDFGNVVWTHPIYLRGENPRVRGLSADSRDRVLAFSVENKQHGSASQSTVVTALRATDGLKLWEARTNAPGGDDGPVKIIVDETTGRSILVGSAFGVFSITYEGQISVFSERGKCLWARALEGPEDRTFFHHAAWLPNGDVVAVGNSGTQGWDRYWIVAIYDGLTGNLKAQTSVDNTIRRANSLTYVVGLRGGRILAAGHRAVSETRSDACLAEFSSTGLLQGVRLSPFSEDVVATTGLALGTAIDIAALTQGEQLRLVRMGLPGP